MKLENSLFSKLTWEDISKENFQKSLQQHWHLC